jgi:hypothetical protein
MEIATAFSAESLRELSRANRDWPYWPVRFVGNSRAFTLLAGFTLFAIRGLYLGFTSDPMNGDSLLTGFVLLILIASTIAILSYRERANIRKQALSPEILILTIDDGGFMSRSSGTQPTQYQWTDFSGFTVGRNLVYLWKKHSRKRAVVIPIDQLPPIEAGQLRSILLSHLPEQ